MHKAICDHMSMTLALCGRDRYVKRKSFFKLSQTICNDIGAVMHIEIWKRKACINYLQTIGKWYQHCMAHSYMQRFNIKLFSTTQILGWKLSCNGEGINKVWAKSCHITTTIDVLHCAENNVFLGSFGNNLVLENSPCYKSFAWACWNKFIFFLMKTLYRVLGWN